MQIAQVRLEENFIVIPISFIEIQKALMSENSAASSSGLLANYAERYLPGADIFNDKNAIGDTVTFYGRTQLLQRLQEELIRYQGIGLLGIRKSGKTSILRHLQFSLREYPVVDIDLQPYGGKNLYGSEIFNQILTRLFSLLRMQDDSLRADLSLDGSLPAKDSALKFVEKIAVLAAKLNKAKFKSPIICFFDELERIFPPPDASQEKIEEFNAFFGALRQLSQQDKSLAFLIADVHPDFNRTNHWYETNLPTNPVYQFFKEVYIEPFSEDATVTMLAELGVFMGIKFEKELLQKIHQMSGGHPFISRQITSILKKKIGDCNYLELSSSQKILDVILRDSNDLRSYFKNNIWGDLEKREFTCAIKAMIILACNDLVKGVSEEKLREKLSNEFSENDCDESLSVLRDSGLIENKDSTHRIIIHLMANWIKRNLTKKEILQWHICSETID